MLNILFRRYSSRFHIDGIDHKDVDILREHLQQYKRSKNDNDMEVSSNNRLKQLVSFISFEKKKDKTEFIYVLHIRFHVHNQNIDIRKYLNPKYHYKDILYHDSLKHQISQ